MIISAIKTNGSEKLLAIQSRSTTNGKPFNTTFCDWNTVPNCLRIFWCNTDIQVLKFNSFSDACKHIFSLGKNPSLIN